MNNRPWLDSYDSGVPHTLEPYPETTLTDLVAENARLRPNQDAVYFKGARMTWSELDRLSSVFARVLVDMGIKRGDCLAILLPNCPQFLFCQLGAWKAGVIVSPLNPRYQRFELEHCLNTTGAQTAVVLATCYDLVKEIQPKTEIKSVIAVNIKDYLPTTTRLLFTLFMEKKGGYRIDLTAGDRWLSSLMDEIGSRGEPVTDPPVETGPEDHALLMFTGGTTGLPKAALATHAALVVTGKQICAWSGAMQEEWLDVSLMLMPMFHAYGNMAVLPTAIVGRHRMALVPDPRDLDDLLNTIDKIKPAYLSGVPTLFIAVLNHKSVQAYKVDFSSIKVCISGAAPLMQETKDRFEAVTGGRIIEAYALTESGLAAVMTPIFGQYKPGAIGVPLPDVEVRIVDAELGEELMPSGEVGEIIMRAPQLMQGYWNQPEATKDTLRNGWLYTGDLGYLDEDGYLYLVDRKKDLIKPSGFQVWPREVEEVISGHPDVLEVGVAGVPDPYQGEAVKAWVVLRRGSSLTVDELRSYCKEQLAAYKVPKRVEFRDSLPKSAVGKVLRKELVAQEETRN